MKELTVLLVDRGDIAEANRHMTRLGGGRIWGSYHPDAPPGVSVCAICDRIVLRGLGRWWPAADHHARLAAGTEEG
jgi:hypothetical protein